jgi:hypothetical protein
MKTSIDRSAACALLLVGVALAACGERDAGTAGQAATSPSQWPATDACAALDKAEAGRILGAEVTATELTVISQMSDNASAVSMCQYSLAGGATMTLLLRHAPYDDATPEAIEQARTSNGNLSPARDVAGPGKATLWSDERKQMQAYLDERRSVVVNLFGLASPGLEEASAIVMAVK